MAVSDHILERLLALHPKVIDLSLDRMWRLLGRLGEPQNGIPAVVHVAGTNGKGSTVAYVRSIMEAAGLRVHSYTSPHLVRFHERIRIGAAAGRSAFIDEAKLVQLLEECEAANAGKPITFFEITTAAAFLAFSRIPADYVVLEVGLGGRLDATNVVDQPRASIITAIDYDHMQYLGDTLPLIAREKAGIIKRGVPCIVGPQPDEAFQEIERRAAALSAPLKAAGRDWQTFEQQGRLVFQDEDGLLDLPRPQLRGRFQFDNAGSAIATIRTLADDRLSEQHIAEGLRSAQWPARMQRLGLGRLSRLIGGESELWVDGGHNASAGRAIAQAFAELEERSPKPLILIVGMLKSKSVADYIGPFGGLAHKVIAVTIPEEPYAYPAEELARIAAAHGLSAAAAASIEDAVEIASSISPKGRILIAGSLYLAGHVLALHQGEQKSSVTGAAR